jgi:hypothetical protein
MQAMSSSAAWASWWRTKPTTYFVSATDTDMSHSLPAQPVSKPEPPPKHPAPPPPRPPPTRELPPANTPAPPPRAHALTTLPGSCIGHHPTTSRPRHHSHFAVPMEHTCMHNCLPSHSTWNSAHQPRHFMRLLLPRLKLLLTAEEAIRALAMCLIDYV